MACVAALVASPALFPFPPTASSLASASCSCRLRPAIVARQQPRGRRALRRFDEVRAWLVGVSLVCPPLDRLTARGWVSVEGVALTEIRLCIGVGVSVLAGGGGVEEAARHRRRGQRRCGVVAAQGPGARRRLQGVAGPRRIGLFCFVYTLHRVRIRW